MNRSPSSDWLPCESLRWMTGPRRDRSAALFVGVTPGTVTNVHNAGQSLIKDQVLREPTMKPMAFAAISGVLKKLT